MTSIEVEAIHCQDNFCNTCRCFHLQVLQRKKLHQKCYHLPNNTPGVFGDKTGDVVLEAMGAELLLRQALELARLGWLHLLTEGLTQLPKVG